MENQFYIIATPIGNLGDISYRAVEILKKADYIACEDTRITKVLAEKYGIKAKLIDCHKFNEKEKSEKIIKLIEEGYKTALVSDAGTPLISDPGSVLLTQLYKKGIKITSLPGACAISTFLSMVPRDTEEFAFIGFIPRSFGKQEEILNKYKNTNCVFYESPNRLMETLKNIKEILGDNTKIAVGRELTKVFEEVKINTVSDILKYYENNPLKGEIVSMIFAKEDNEMPEEDILQKIKILKEEGYSPKDTAKIISALYKENKNKVYKLAIKSNE